MLPFIQVVQWAIYLMGSYIFYYLYANINLMTTIYLELLNKAI